MRIPLLVTLDENYIPQLRVLMTSIYINNPDQPFDLYLLHSRITDHTIIKLQKEMERFQFNLYPIKTDDQIFEDAKVTDRYPKEMYYRLLSAQWLPDDLDKIIYLDPDILVINPLYDLWNMDISDWLFAAAAHTGKTDLANEVNRLRLKTENNYYNSGVLLINLKLARKEISPQKVFEYVEKNELELLLPDQDVLNALYGHRILEIEDVRWNYDARNYNNYLLRSFGEYNINWVLENTSVIHFCGRDKPWRANYNRRFGIIYKHYMNLTNHYLDFKDVFVRNNHR